MSRRRRLFAVSALLTIGAALGVAPIIAAPALADGGLELTTPIDGATWSLGGTALISGLTNDTGNPITVSDEGGTPTGCDTVTIDGFGNWACAAATPLTDWDPGHHTLTATQGSKTDVVEFDIRPPVPTVDQSSISIAEGGTLHYSGTTTYDNADIIINMVDGDHCGAAPYPTSGTAWWCDLGGWSGTGNFPATVRQVVNGVSSNDVAVDVWVVAPGVTITSPSGSPPTVVWWYGNVLYIAGTAEDSSTPVDILVPGQTGCSGLDVDDLTLQWECYTWYPDAGNGVIITAMQSPTVYDELAIDVLVQQPDLDIFGTLPAEVHNFGAAALYYAEGTVHVRIQGYPALSCDADVHATPVLYMDPCEIDLSSLTIGDSYVAEYWHDTETGDGVHDTATFTATESGAPQASCTFVPAGANITAPEGFDLWVSGPIIQGGAEPMFPEAPGDCGGAAGTAVTEVDSWGPDLCQDVCDLSGLEPGVYDVYYSEVEGDSYDWFFTVPVAPSLDQVTRSGATVTARGTSLPQHPVRVMNGTASVCQTTADDGGNWNCSFSTTATSLRAVQLDTASGGISPLSAASAVPAPPSVTPAKPAWSWTFSIDGTGPYHPGDTVSFVGSGVPAGTTIVIELHSTVRTLGTTTAGEDGSFAYTATIPADIEPGEHHFVLTATPPGEAPTVLEQPIEIIELPLPPATEDEPAADAEVLSETGSGAGGGSGARNEPAAPSILSGSLATFGHIAEDPFVLVLAGGLTIALLFLVAVPTELLNSTLSANTGRLGRVFVAVDDRLERFKAWFIRVTRSRALASGILVLVLSLIYGFTDPDFAFDLVSLRLVLSLAIGMFVLTYLVGWFTGLLSRVTWGVHGQVDLRPSIAIFAVVGVIAARILEFSPGFFVGVVIGLELLQASQRVASRVALLQFTLVVSVAVGAWLWYSALVSGGPPTDFGGALLGDTLVALTAEGLTAAAIAILPLRFLEGRELYKESKVLWLGVFLVIAFAFALLVLPTAIKGTEVGDVGVWVIVFLVFGVLTLALWATFARMERRRELLAAEERTTTQYDQARG